MKQRLLALLLLSGCLQPNAAEVCNDALDNNGDGLIDCDDPDCAQDDACPPEVCDDALDNNGDGLIDCDDPDCDDAASCADEICNNNLDDNLNGLTDCDDPDCDAVCGDEVCDNSLDDDQDNLTDCNDPDCITAAVCLLETQCGLGGVACCADGADNNLDGLTDCDDPDCTTICTTILCGDGVITGNEACDDGNNSSGDCCSSDCSQATCPIEIDCGQGAFNCCSDGVDNNADGTTDCSDVSCAAACVTLNCGNGQLNAGEVCDDGNNTSGDCCSETCSQVTCDSEIEPNNISADATGPLDIPSSVIGSINPGAEDDFYSVNLTLPGRIRYETSDSSGLGSCVNADTTVTAFNTNGNTTIGSAAGGGIGLCAVFVTPDILQPGIYFVKVESGLNNTIPAYVLHVSGIICGDGDIALNSTEQCDNGSHCQDLTSCTSDAECVGVGDELCRPRRGDGCDESCLREPLCGDNFLDFPPEQCDDGSTCADGTTVCNGDASLCVGIGDELCTTKSDDGCDANCLPTGCLNGIVTTGEECDDGNPFNGDGCDINCTFSACGNGIVGAPEQCDQTNINGASCVSLGFASGSLACDINTCNFNTSACAPSVCGNNTTETGEQCDDGNNSNGDGCASGCTFEIVAESEPNNSIAEADGPFTSPFLAEGSINVNNDADFYAFTLSSLGALQIETFDGNGPSTCNGGITTTVELRAPDGTTVLVTDSSSGPNGCSFIGPTAPGNDAAARNLAPGTYFIRVIEAGQNSTISTYRLRISLVALCGNNVTESAGAEGCDDGNLLAGDGCDGLCRTEICGNNRLDANEQCDDNNTNNGDCCSSACQVEADCVFEIEPNNSAATANGPISDGKKVAANISPSADVDFFSLVIPNRVDLKLETQNLTNTNCSTTQDTVLDFINTNGTTVIATNNDISGTNRCSRLDGTEGATGSLSNMKALAPGTYFIRVSENGNNSQITNYRLLVSFASLCGDGVVESSEPCDDGNQTPGDGCENTCIITPACGNNVVEVGEECDDGDLISGDGCESDCTLTPTPVCGNDIIEAGEACDDGAFNSDIASDACRLDCSLFSCGDGTIDSNESCDDGNLSLGDGCDAACLIE